MTQVLNPSHLLPGTLGEENVSFRRLRRDRSVSRESCAWSCGALSRLFQGAEKSMSSLSSSWEAGLGRVQGMRWSGLSTPSPCSPPTVCWQPSSAAWAAFRTYSFAVCLLITVKCAKISRGIPLDDPRETRLQDLP